MFKQYQEQSKDYENWGADIILYSCYEEIPLNYFCNQTNYML